MIPALLALLQILPHAQAQSPECPESAAPSQLAAVTVWTREFNGSFSYRISDEDLSDEGYKRGSVDRDDVVVMLARSPGKCTLGPCSLELSTNVRNNDEAISQQENVLGIPDGFTDLHDTFYCVRRFGDCGARRPLFRFTKGFGLSIVYAYSLDPEASFPGYSGEGKVLCYGWADNGSVVHANSMDSSCLPVGTVANGKVSYSSLTSNIYSIGTTATLICDEGYVNGGQSTVLCVKSGWYPATGLGYCVKQNQSLVSFDTSRAVSSSSLECAALGSIRNGRLVYSGLANGGRFPQGTRATVLCDTGYNIFGSEYTVCKHGKWNRKHGICDSKLNPKCPALQRPPAGKISYSNPEPYSPSTTATLSCDFGLGISGGSILTCTEDGWEPREGFGVCQAETFGLGCGPVVIFGGSASYIQSNALIPYSSGTSVFVMCNIGYTPDGSMTAVCQNGVWTPTLGTCTLSTNSLTGLDGDAACTAMLTPLNGFVTYSVNGIGTYAAGTVATLSCNLGFTISGAMSSTCSGGTWVPPVLGTCNQGLDGLDTNGILSCGNPIVLNGVVTFSWGTSSEPTKPSGTVALLACNAGFIAAGSTTSTCQNGIWSPALGICSMSTGDTQLTCNAMFPPLGGTISYSTGSIFGPFNSGTVAVLKCNSGFPSGTSIATCLNGEWSPPTLGTCPLDQGGSGGIYCTALLPPFGGHLVYSSGSIVGPFPPGTTVSLQCNMGYPSGTTSATCSNGQWSPPSLGTCSTTGGNGGSGGLKCLAPITPLGAMLSYSTGTAFGPFPSGTVVTMRCIAGSPLGATQATCSNGQWFPPSLGTCDSSNGGGTTCPELDVPRGGIVTLTNSGNGVRAAQGTIANLYCPLGVQGSASALCSNGMWTPSKLGTCIGFPDGGTSTCHAITAPFGATLSYSNMALFGPFPDGTTVTARCLNGAMIIGASTATCRNGQWLPPSLGTCSSSGGGSGSTCPSIQVVGGSINYSDGPLSNNHPTGSTATLLCNTGIPFGPSLSICQNGQWIPTLGSCPNSGNGMQCAVPPTIPTGATLTYSSGNSFGPWNSGTTATMACPLGQSVVGSATTTCNNGIWSMLGSCSSTGTILPCYFGLLEPPNGSIEYTDSGPPYEAGSTATLRCDTGYTVMGAGTAFCTNGSFTPIGSCRML